MVNINLKNTVLFLFIVFSYYSSFGQTIQVSLNYNNTKDSTKIFFSKSFDDNPSHFVTKEEYRYLVDKMEVFFPLKSIGIIQIESEGTESFKATLIGEKKDSINIAIDKGDKKLDLKFDGNNSSGIDLINSELFTSKFYFTIGEIFSNSVTSDEVLYKIEGYKAQCFFQLDELLRENKISRNFLDFSKKYFETEIAALSYVYLNGFVTKDYPYPRKLNDKEVQITIQKIDAKYDVFNKKYDQIRTKSMYYACSNKCLFIEKGILKGKILDFGLWNGIDKLKYKFAPKSIQEFIVYYEIIKNDFDIDLYRKYIGNFSNGVYCAPLLKKFNSYRPLSFLPKPNILVSVKANEKKVEVLKQNQYNSIFEFVADNYKGKAVFIDIWATWCAPCKEEFKHNDELESFLNSYDISFLYVTVDDLRAINKWENFIIENKLLGNHFFPDSVFKENLKSILEVEGSSIPVPRYLLFNSNGELVLKNARRPSQGKLLYDEIKNAL